MTRATLLATSVVLAGCMRIYPDGELPDLEVTWFVDDCRPETPAIAVSLVNLGERTTEDRVVPCTDNSTTFVDIKPARYRVNGMLLLESGEPFAVSTDERDMRDGFDAEAFLYFGGGAWFRVAWEFDMGASCESLGAEIMELAFESDLLQFSYETECIATPFVGYPSGQDLRLQLRAHSDTGVVATSPYTPEFTPSPPSITDVGTLTLTPCTPGPCP